MNQQDYLQHYGVLGMKWGHRGLKSKSSGSSSKSPSKRQLKKETLKKYRQDKGPKRFKVMNAANSAARTYYRKERTGSFKTYRDQGHKLDRKEARLTNEQIQSGRYRVARARSIKRNIGSTAVAVALGSAAVSSGAAAAAPIIMAAGGVSAHFVTGAHYYGRERRSYGGTRAKYQNQKRVRDKQ